MSHTQKVYAMWTHIKTTYPQAGFTLNGYLAGVYENDKQVSSKFKYDIGSFVFRERDTDGTFLYTGSSRHKNKTISGVLVIMSMFMDDLKTHYGY